MRGIRNWLSAGVLAALVAACSAAVYDSATRPVRLVDQLDHEQLLTWLAMGDLSSEYVHIKVRLARRLAEDFRQGYDWDQDLADLDTDRRGRFAANFRELVGVWLLDRADRYVSLADQDRTAFIDEQLDDVLYWPIWQQRRTRNLERLLPQNPAVAVHQIDGWIDGFEPPQRHRIQQFKEALYFRWLQRGLPFRPGGV